MDDERKQEILEQAFATLDRLADFKVEQRDLDPEDDALLRWDCLRRQSQPAPAPPKREPAVMDRDWSAWNEWVDERIAHAIEHERTLLTEAHGEVIAHERQATRKLIEALRLELDALRHDFAKQRAITEGDVVDLPPLLRRRHD
jgi:hypothetical protein